MKLIFILCFVYVSSAEPTIKNVTPPIQHAEGPHWDHRKQVLYYVDTFKATAICWDPKSNNVATYTIPNRNSIAIIVPIKNKINEFIVGADRYIYRLVWNGKDNKAAKLEEHLMVEKAKTNNQFNDGKSDCEGRLWIGTLTRNSDLSVADNGGALYEIIGENTLKYNSRVVNTSISNGIAWSKNNKLLYYIDSKERSVVKYDFNVQSGEISNGKVLFDLGSYPEIKGIPDGMTIDSDDNLWVALYGGGCILKVDGRNGEVLQTVKMPVTYVTSVAFGGPNLDVLYATTSRQKLDERQVAEQPLAGSVFQIDNLGVRGLPANEFVLKQK